MPVQTPADLSAAVSPTGRVEERDGARAAQLLEGQEQLIDCAVAFLGTHLADARFCWRVGSRDWWLVSIVRGEASTPGEERAILAWVPDKLPFQITTRELDVLTLVAAGLTNPEIADVLITSHRTVATHVASLLHKLDLSSRAGAAAMAIEEGLVRLPLPDPPTSPPRRPRLAVEYIEVALRRAPEPDRLSGAPRPAAWRSRPFLLGSTFPQRGPAAADGLEMRNGSALAIDEINRRGGIAGRPVKQVLVGMDPLDHKSVRNAFAQLATAEVDAITSGYVFTADTALELAAEYGAPFLHGQTEESYVSFAREEPIRFGNVFQVCPTEIHYGRGFLRFLDSMVQEGNWQPQSRRVLFLETEASGADMTTQTALTAAEASGWEVLRVTGIAANEADWRPVIAEIHRLAPAAILVAAFVPSELAAFQRAFVADPLPALIYAVYAPSVPEFLSAAGDSADGLVWATMSGTYRDILGSRFASSYQRSYSYLPGRAHAGIAYDEVYMLARAWSAVDNPRRFKDVSDLLRASVHRGVNGSYFFGHERQCGLAYPDDTRDPSLGQAHLVFQISGNDHSILWPPPYVERGFHPPPWW